MGLENMEIYCYKCGKKIKYNPREEVEMPTGYETWYDCDVWLCERCQNAEAKHDDELGICKICGSSLNPHQVFRVAKKGDKDFESFKCHVICEHGHRYTIEISEKLFEKIWDELSNEMDYEISMLRDLSTIKLNLLNKHIKNEIKRRKMGDEK